MCARGISLIELMVTLLLLGILLMLGIPVGSNFMQRNRLSLASNEVFAALSYSRHYALTLGKTLVLTPSCGVGNCGDDWSQGAILFADNDGSHHFNPHDNLIQSWQWYAKDVLIIWDGFVSSQYIEFPADGINGAMSGTFSLCLRQRTDTIGNSIVVNRLGRARLVVGGGCS